MTNPSLFRSLTLSPFASFLVAAPSLASAQLAQTFVSSAGNDTNPCSQAPPCATFQSAINATAPGGEVDAMTTGNFGTFGVISSITIDGKGLASIASFGGGAYVVINADPGSSVILRAITISGANSPASGIYFEGGGSLLVDGCTITGFINSPGSFIHSSIVLASNTGSATPVCSTVGSTPLD